MEASYYGESLPAKTYNASSNNGIDTQYLGFTIGSDMNEPVIVTAILENSSGVGKCESANEVYVPGYGLTA